MDNLFIFVSKMLEKKLAELKTLEKSLDIASAESNVEKANQKVMYTVSYLTNTDS
jgi:hypothetical protein